MKEVRLSLWESKVFGIMERALSVSREDIDLTPKERAEMVYSIAEDIEYFDGVEEIIRLVMETDPHRHRWNILAECEKEDMPEVVTLETIVPSVVYETFHMEVPAKTVAFEAMLLMLKRTKG